MENFYDLIVVGGGIVGMATAYKINTRNPAIKILVLEKESDVAAHQTGHNSGVIHSGIYYKPNSYKAKLCVNGRRELVAFAKEHKVPHDICGKIIVATKQTELAHMNKVFNNGLANGVEGIEKIDNKKIKEIEPCCEGIEGIWVPCTGIINFAAVTLKYRELFEATFPQSKVLVNCAARAFEHHTDYTSVITNKGTFNGENIITAGGLQADRLAAAAGSKSEAHIVGFRGDYYDLTDHGKSKVRNLIYPVPNPEFPFLGVHFTRMIDNSIECGPNAVFVFKREGYNKTDFSLGDTVEALKFKGTWQMFFKHWRFGLDEYKRAFSKKRFLTSLQELVPSLTMEDIKPGRAGVRAMAIGADGETLDDFKIEQKNNMLHVINAPSPAATASLAIGNAIADMAAERFSFN
jgi:L-2-hydroxyglutarate oxidase